MERIASFCIDHLKLKRGIYVSRKDYVGKEVLTSFDIRMKLPYREPVLGSPKYTLSSTSPLLGCATTPSGKTKLSTGDLWAV